ncbi:MAG: ATP-binding protein [Bdellovibrionota bacterium]
MPLVPRAVADHLLEELRRSPVVFLNGPRQAGKSTLARAILKKAWPAEYVTLDEATQLGAASADPEGFLRGHEGPLVIDEVQMAPGLFRALKVAVDEARLENPRAARGRYLLTGSANVLALPKLSSALVGRMAVVTLYPFSALEISRGKGGFLPTLFENGFKSRRSGEGGALLEVLRRATFPEIAEEGDAARARWFENYVTAILQRDVRQIADIEKLGVLPNLLRVLAGRTGGLINESDIGRSVGLNSVTARNYRVLLGAMFLTFGVGPWFRNTGKRFVKSPKGYLTDTPLLCHLLQVDPGKAAARDPALFGRVLENFVASELLKQLAHSGERAELLHFRGTGGQEADFVLERPGGAVAGIEVKARESVGPDDFRGLKELQARAGKDFACGAVLYRGASFVPFGEKLWAVPVSALWE